jgi:hypothetical protein
MICIKCGLMKRGDKDFFECDDCKEFSKLVRIIFEDIHENMERAGSIDPDSHLILRLLADSTFVTSKNPHAAIFYKISDYIISEAFAGATEVTEDELNRNVMTTRGWGDAFRIFEELNLVRIRTEKFRRILVLTDKTVKFASQYLTAERLSEIGLRIRLAHIYAGYVLLYILYKMADLSIESFNKSLLPYHQRPRTLWITLMFLWSNAYLNRHAFSDEDLRVFISKRRIPSTTRGKIMNALEAKDGRSTQGLIKGVSIEGDGRKFEFEDYVLLEMQRIRKLIRERER